MAIKYYKLEVLLLALLYNIQADYQQNFQNHISTISQVAEAFLFHQLQPTQSSFHTNLHENTSLPAYYLNNYHSARSQLTSNRAQHEQASRDLSSSTTNEEFGQHQDEINGCPVECHCNKTAKIADCANKNLNRVPSGFPADIKRIRLERNNITELGPYTFQGLKRLQRIDLSNNNLQKIDPLAFSGGLQSLTSLILFNNKLSQLPANVFDELNQLQLLLLNANNLQCINKQLFQPLTNLNLLSLYDNNIETLTNGTFDGLKSIKTIHLGKNPLVCDCNLRWLAEYLERKPGTETSEAECRGPEARNAGKKLSQLKQQKFRCEGDEQSKTSLMASQCNPDLVPHQKENQQTDSSCPSGCICNGSTVDCSPRENVTFESRPGLLTSGAHELPIPDIPDDIPIYVTRMRINDNRIKRIRQTGLFRRLANSQKLDLGNNKIVDIEDNAINGASGSIKPERVVFILLENDHCDSKLKSSHHLEDACSLAPTVNPPNYDSPCYNGGSCISNSVGSSNRALTSFSSNYSCLCPPGFAGTLCEVNIDDCIEHQCQNGAMCQDGINSYKCICRDPTTTGEFCEQLNSFSTNSANSIAPMALPMIASQSSSGSSSSSNGGSVGFETVSSVQHGHQFNEQQEQILPRSVAFADKTSIDMGSSLQSGCKRITERKFYQDGNGCQSVRMLKISECAGACGTSCCVASKVKRRRIRMQCTDGASYVKTIDLIKKCACSNECTSGSHQLEGNHQYQPQSPALANPFNAPQEDQLLPITRLDAVD